MELLTRFVLAKFWLTSRDPKNNARGRAPKTRATWAFQFQVGLNNPFPKSFAVTHPTASCPPHTWIEWNAHGIGRSPDRRNDVIAILDIHRRRRRGFVCRQRHPTPTPTPTEFALFKFALLNIEHSSTLVSRRPGNAHLEEKSAVALLRSRQASEHMASRMEV